MQWLSEICVRRPVFATVIVLSLVVVGFFSYTRLGVDQFPKVDFPIVTVTVNEDGASPEEIENNVVDPIEESVNTVSGIDTLASYSYEGLGQVIITFHLSKDINVAVDEVRSKVNEILPTLPTDVKPPVIDKVDPDAAPIMQIALSGPGGIRAISTYADQVLRRQIESITGVGQVTLLGARKRQINIYLDPNKLRQYNLTAIDVSNALQRENLQAPGGQVDEGTTKLTLQIYGRVSHVAQFGDIVIAHKNGAFIHISDVGVVHDGMEEEKTSADVSGSPTVLLSIRKQSGLNTVATVDALRSKLADIRQALPPGYQIRVVNDQSTYIRASTNAVKEHLVVGSICAALVVLLFLWNWRTTIISGLAIPASIISTFTLIYAMGFTLNGLTLLGLTLSVGIVIDDAIVVLENIYRFIEEKGMRPFDAAIEATREIGLAVMATTLSLVAIFLPVAFMTGIVGRFLNSFGLTMAFAIMVSLLVSFTLTPMLSSRWIKSSVGAEPDPATEGLPVGLPIDSVTQEPHQHHNESKERGLYHFIDVAYTALIKWSLNHRWVIVAVCFAVLFVTPSVLQKVPKNFLPDDDQSQFQVIVRAPEGTSLVSTRALGDRIAADIRKLPDVKYTVDTIGDNAQQTENLATIFVQMVDATKRTDGYTQDDVMQMVRTKVMPQFGNLRTNVGPIAAISTGAPSFVITESLNGPSLTKLAEYSQKALTELKKVPGVVDADTSLVVGQPELDVHIDRQKAADLGVSVQDIANTMHIMVGGAHISDFFQGGEQYEVHLRSLLPFRSNAQAISQLTVPSSTQGSVPLDQVVTLVPNTGPSQISRLNRQRNVLIECNLLPGASQQAVSAKLTQILNNLHMPPEYHVMPFGTSKELVKAFVAFLSAMVLALIFMYLVLAAQFESWLHPLTIMSALPLTAPFAILSILIFHRSLNIFSILGTLVLFGVVKKNGILQVDHTNQLRAQGMNRYDAIVQANRDRLRPILMTTLAFVAGLVPLVLSNGTGAATNKDIGYTVIGGQSMSLLLTLVATPVIYSLMDDLSIFITRSRDRVAALVSRKR